MAYRLSATQRPSQGRPLGTAPKIVGRAALFEMRLGTIPKVCLPRELALEPCTERGNAGKYHGGGNREAFIVPGSMIRFN